LARKFKENRQQPNPEADAKMEINTWKTQKGPTKNQMEDTVGNDLKEWGLDVSTAKSLAMDKSKWKTLVKIAKAAPLDATR